MTTEKDGTYSYHCLLRFVEEKKETLCVAKRDSRKYYDFVTGGTDFTAPPGGQQSRHLVYLTIKAGPNAVMVLN